MIETGGASPNANYRIPPRRERPKGSLRMRLLKLAIVLTIVAVCVLALLPALERGKYSPNPDYSRRGSGG